MFFVLLVQCVLGLPHMGHVDGARPVSDLLCRVNVFFVWRGFLTGVCSYSGRRAFLCRSFALRFPLLADVCCNRCCIYVRMRRSRNKLFTP